MIDKYFFKTFINNAKYGLNSWNCFSRIFKGVGLGILLKPLVIVLMQRVAQATQPFIKHAHFYIIEILMQELTSLRLPCSLDFVGTH